MINMYGSGNISFNHKNVSSFEDDIEGKKWTDITRYMI